MWNKSGPSNADVGLINLGDFLQDLSPICAVVNLLCLGLSLLRLLYFTLALFSRKDTWPGHFLREMSQRATWLMVKDKLDFLFVNMSPVVFEFDVTLQSINFI